MCRQKRKKHAITQKRDSHVFGYYSDKIVISKLRFWFFLFRAANTPWDLSENKRMCSPVSDLLKVNFAQHLILKMNAPKC